MSACTVAAALLSVAKLNTAFAYLIAARVPAMIN
jgi:hypothetical protein